MFFCKSKIVEAPDLTEPEISKLLAFRTVTLSTSVLAEGDAFYLEIGGERIPVHCKCSTPTVCRVRRMYPQEISYNLNNNKED